MGALDVHCALCGGPLAPPLAHLFPPPPYNISHAELAAASESYVAIRAQLSWLRDLRVIGRDPETGRAYLTGKGHAEGYGYVLVEPGGDESAPAQRRRFGEVEGGM
ncbi:hypothetical protein LTR53_018347, partial [Teratosphaeriaceae sp. CCFEE 6253]